MEMAGRRQVARDLDAIATQPSVFDDPATLEAYRPPPQYENTHRFDPKTRWTWRKKRLILYSLCTTSVGSFNQSVVRKIDLRIMIWATTMFFALDLDRSNIFPSQHGQLFRRPQLDDQRLQLRKYTVSPLFPYRWYVF